MFGRVVSEDRFLILYYPDKYMTQKMHDKAVDASLTTLKLIPDWVVTSKMVNLDNNFDEGDPDAIILFRPLAWYIKFEKRKVLKK